MREHASARRLGGTSEAIRGFAAPDARRSYAPDLALEPTHIEVRLAFDVETKSAAGSVTTTVRANRAGARSIRLDAIGFEDVAVEGAEGRYDGDAIHVAWGEGFAVGEERSVTVRYAVRNPITGLMFGAPDIVATDHETERARYWLPCVDYPTVRTTYEFFLTARSEYTILANGLLLGETDNGDGTKTAQWKLDYPCPSYLCCLAIGRFVEAPDGEHGGRAIAYFGPDGVDPDDLRATFAGTDRMMAWLEEKLGAPFPFGKYYQFLAPGIGGAMENISLVSWDSQWLCDETMLPEYGWVAESVNLHEMSHSYFGDAIVCRTSSTRGSRSRGPPTWRRSGSRRFTAGTAASTTCTATRAPTWRRPGATCVRSSRAPTTRAGICSTCTSTPAAHGASICCATSSAKMRSGRACATT